jgi:hypothetical protein
MALKFYDLVKLDLPSPQPPSTSQEKTESASSETIVHGTRLFHLLASAIGLIHGMAFVSR